MSGLLKFLSGKKTYIIIGLTAIGVILRGLGIAIPEYAWELLALAGFGAVRSTLKKMEK